MRRTEVRTNQGVVEQFEARKSPVQALVDKALAEIQLVHADKAYHGVDHTRAVMSRVVRFLNIVRQVRPEMVTDRDYEIAPIAPAYHDLIQDYDVVEGKRVRKVGLNEWESACRAAVEMQSVMNADGTPYFTDEEVAQVVDADMHTVPAWDPENRTVYQPALTPDSSLIARALAYADIGSAALDGAEAAIRDADALFLEDNIELVQVLMSGVATPELLADFKAQVIGWTRLQEGFIEGRRNRLDTELAGLPDDLQQALKSTFFIHYDEALFAMRLLVEERETMQPEDIFKGMLARCGRR